MEQYFQIVQTENDLKGVCQNFNLGNIQIVQIGDDEDQVILTEDGSLVLSEEQLQQLLFQQTDGDEQGIPAQFIYQNEEQLIHDQEIIEETDHNAANIFIEEDQSEGQIENEQLLEQVHPIENFVIQSEDQSAPIVQQKIIYSPEPETIVIDPDQELSLSDQLQTNIVYQTEIQQKTISNQTQPKTKQSRKKPPHLQQMVQEQQIPQRQIAQQQQIIQRNQIVQQQQTQLVHTSVQHQHIDIPQKVSLNEMEVCPQQQGQFLLQQSHQKQIKSHQRQEKQHLPSQEQQHAKQFTKLQSKNTTQQAKEIQSSLQQNVHALSQKRKIVQQEHLGQQTSTKKQDRTIAKISNTNKTSTIPVKGKRTHQPTRTVVLERISRQDNKVSNITTTKNSDSISPKRGRRIRSQPRQLILTSSDSNSSQAAHQNDIINSSTPEEEEIIYEVIHSPTSIDVDPFTPTIDSSPESKSYIKDDATEEIQENMSVLQPLADTLSPLGNTPYSSKIENEPQNRINCDILPSLAKITKNKLTTDIGPSANSTKNISFVKNEWNYKNIEQQSKDINSEIKYNINLKEENKNISCEFEKEISHKQAKMLVIQRSGQQTCITFNLPSETCTVSEILTQAGIPHSPKTLIQCLARPCAEYDFIVTVGVAIKQRQSESKPIDNIGTDSEIQSLDKHPNQDIEIDHIIKKI